MPDPDTGELIYDARVAEIPAYTAFTVRGKSEQVTARLITGPRPGHTCSTPSTPRPTAADLLSSTARAGPTRT